MAWDCKSRDMLIPTRAIQNHPIQLLLRLIIGNCSSRQNWRVDCKQERDLNSHHAWFQNLETHQRWNHHGGQWTDLNLQLIKQQSKLQDSKSINSNKQEPPLSTADIQQWHTRQLTTSEDPKTVHTLKSWAADWNPSSENYCCWLLKKNRGLNSNANS